MNKRQQLVNKLRNDIEKNCRETPTNYYGDIVLVYENIDEYLECLDNIYDKISLAQWANNYQKVEELMQQVQLPHEQEEIYLRLKDKNIEINETINLEILSPRYEFLNNMLDMITTDIEIQEQIISLSDEMLEMFKILYERINELTDYSPPYITNILRKMSDVPLVGRNINAYHYYDELNQDIERLIKEGYKFTSQEIDTLLFLYNSNTNFTVRNMEEVINFGKKDTQDQKETDLIIEKERNKENKNLDNIKFALLVKTYGIGINTAKEILKRYDLTSLELTKENKDLFEMYKSILQIVNESNPDILISVYDKFSKKMNPSFDFRRTATFENALRKEFAKSLNNSVFKPEGHEYKLIDGVKVYDAGLEFKMIVTAIGAYQGKFKNQDNYSDYWNSSYIRSHGNCCSLIGNNNLSMAKVKNIILGFSTMSENMLLLSSDKDLDSTPDSRKFNPTENSNRNIFTSADNLLDITRGEYNELVYERRDLSTNPKFYKKNPDYIVFIEEYEDIDQYIELYREVNEEDKVEYLLKQKEKQARQWKETLKAAQDFGIPIVKINREKCAKNESQKIENMMLEFEQTKNPKLISKIITQFHNNRFGNKEGHSLIIKVYFSKSIMEKYLERIDNTILSIEDEKVRTNVIDAYRKSIESEYKKIDYYRYIADTKKLSAIDFDKTLKVIEAMKQFTGYSDNPNISSMKGK